MKRIILFVATNLAVVLVIGVLLRLLGLDRIPIGRNGEIHYSVLLAGSAVIGFAGSIISLLLSKTMAKMSVGAHVIEHPKSEGEAWLLRTVTHLAQKCGIGVPEVAIYDSPEPNAFATGARRNNALVAVSTGLLQSMTREEAEAVLAHEVSHVANGDMVTLTLLQGVLNTFVIFLSRILGFVVDSFLSRREDGERQHGGGMGSYMIAMVAQLVLGVFASMIVAWFSRRREFRADAGAAELRGPQPMISALMALRRAQGEPTDLPRSVATFGIRGGGVLSLFASHPPLEARIAALRTRNLPSSGIPYRGSAVPR